MDTQQRILECAERLFTTQGYDHTTMDQIAGEIRLSKGALYYFFKNKSELFCRIVDNGIDYIEKCVDQQMHMNESDRRISRNILQIYIDIAYDNSNIVLMLLGGQMYGADSNIGAMLKERLERLLQSMEHIIQIGVMQNLLLPMDTQMAARALIGMIYGIVTLPNPPSREKATAFLRSTVENSLYLKNGEKEG